MRQFVGGWLTLAAGTPWFIIWAQRLTLLLLGLWLLKAVISLWPKRPGQ